MKLGLSALFVLLCFAGGAAASTTTSAAVKVQRFANPVLCYLDTAAPEGDAMLVRAELQRREVACTSELKAEGQLAVERSFGLARLQATSVSLQRAQANREFRDRQEYLRAARCSRQQGYC